MKTAAKTTKKLVFARRLKPLSSKKQAIEQLRELQPVLQFHTTDFNTSIIRQALEALPK